MPKVALQQKSPPAFKKASELVAVVTARALQVAKAQPKNSSRVVVLARALKAILEVLEKIDAGKVASASSDFEVLLSLLEQPETIAKLSQQDPLAQAKLRGLRTQLKLLDAEGGCVSADEAGKLLGITKAAIHKARSEGRLLGLPRGQNQFVFPMWQFSSGNIIGGLRDIYHALPGSPWMQASFMLSPNTRLSNKAPISVLRLGDKESVIEAARAYGKHGAV